MKKQGENKKVVIYQAKNGAIELRGDVSRETIWATQAQIASAFEVDVRTINEHIQNILRTKELDEKATIRNFRITQMEGNLRKKCNSSNGRTCSANFEITKLARSNLAREKRENLTFFSKLQRSD